MPKHPSHKLIKGLGAAALLTATAAGYYFAGPRGKKHQAKATAWVKTAKKDLTVRLEKMQAVTEDGYQKAVSDVLNKYRQIKVPRSKLRGIKSGQRAFIARGKPRGIEPFLAPRLARP